MNLIPFLSPSNIVISGAVGSLFPHFNPLLVGFLVALGASIAKTVHFTLSFFVVKVLNKEKQAKLESYSRNHRFKKLGMIAAFIAAVSPVPDDPIVIPLGLMRYSPIKFFSAYFTGKIIVTVTGAYLGQTASLTLEQYMGNTATIVLSITLTFLITLILIKKEFFLEKLKAHGLFPFKK